MYSRKDPWRRPVEIPHLPPLPRVRVRRDDRVERTAPPEPSRRRATLDPC